jgi:hypothetical protein
MSRYRRLTTCVLLVAYLAANVLGGWLHDHPHAGSVALACHCAGHAHSHDHDEAGSSDSQPTIARDSDEHALHDDACSVCRFAGQRVLVAEAAPLEQLCDLVVDLTTVHDVAFVATIARTAHSRAPPRLL